MKVRSNTNSAKESIIKRTADNYVQRFDFTDRTNGQLVYLTNILDGRINVCNERANGLYDMMYKSFVRNFIEQFCPEKTINPFKKAANKAFLDGYKKSSTVMVEGQKRNPIKEAAWVVCHSDKFGYKLTWDEYRVLIPCNESPEVIRNWNHFIEKEIDDVDENIKKMFIIEKNHDCGIFSMYSSFINNPDAYKEVVEDKQKDDAEVVEIATPSDKESAEAKAEFQEVVDELDAEVDAEVDDAPVEKAGAEKAASDENKKQLSELQQMINNIAAATSTSELDENQKGDIYNMLSSLSAKFNVKSNLPMVIDVEATEIVDTETAEKNAQLDAEMKDAIARDDEKDAKKAEKVEAEVVEAVPEHPTEGTAMAENNVPWEVRVPKLNVLTNICKAKGLAVQYELCELPGIILANVLKSDGHNLMLQRQLLVDPMIVYGDTIRVVPVTSFSNEFDIRKEMFIPINNKQLIEKAIDGTLTKEDREAFFKNLPRCLSDFRGKYHFLDRVDLRCLTSDGSTVNFFTWRSLVTNISKVLKEVPEDMRFRVVKFKNGNHFELICDEKVLSSIKTNIFNEQTHIDGAGKRFRVVYDSDKYNKDGKNFKVFIKNNK